MANSIFFAQLIGVFALIMGLSMLFRRRMLMSIFRDVFHHRALSYILGVIILLLGLLLILSHNIWEFSFPLIITLLGWLVLLEGIFYLFASQTELAIGLDWLNSKKVYYFIAAAYLAVGFYLSYHGFFLFR